VDFIVIHVIHLFLHNIEYTWDKIIQIWRIVRTFIEALSLNKIKKKKIVEIVKINKQIIEALRNYIHEQKIN
jgi:hypothetical protein